MLNIEGICIPCLTNGLTSPGVLESSISEKKVFVLMEMSLNEVEYEEARLLIEKAANPESRFGLDSYQIIEEVMKIRNR